MQTASPGEGRHVWEMVKYIEKTRITYIMI